MIVTIVTPTLNAIAHFHDCILSVQRNRPQSIVVEHIIVDGGSTDGTVELAKSCNLKVMQGKDKGIFDAINKGSFNSSGELIGFLGADDMLVDGAMEAIVGAYRRSGKRWIIGGTCLIDKLGNNVGRFAPPPRWLQPRILACCDWNPIVHMSTYFSRDLFSELGGFNIEFKVASDFEMFVRALAAAPFGTVSDQISCYRHTGSNFSTVNYQRAVHEAGLIVAAYGPASRAERQFWRYVMKFWLTLRNPEWSARRRLGGLLRWAQPSQRM